MKKILMLMLVFGSLLIASDTKNDDSDRKSRVAKQLKIDMEKEKKHSQEQKFYKGADYDLRSSEVNKDSLSTLPDIKVDDLDMDSVYD